MSTFPPTIHITGGLGFIGSNLVRHLNAAGFTPYVYDHIEGHQWRNVAGLPCVLKDWRKVVEATGDRDEVLIHLGADVDTTAPMSEDLWETNVKWSLRVLNHFVGCRRIYVSSAAVYGAEEKDFTERLTGITPLNAYAYTKLALDQAVFGPLTQLTSTGQTYGLRLFNVYGPNEGHKGDMASVVHKALTGKLTHYPDGWVAGRGDPTWQLFASHRPDIANGDQRRDFVHVDDVCEVILHFALAPKAPASGLYNVGTGTARTFNDLVRAIDPSRPITYREMPKEIRDQYQYHTKADLTRLRKAGYTAPFIPIEQGVRLMGIPLPSS